MSSKRLQIIPKYFNYLFASLSLFALGWSVAGYFGRWNLYLEFASGYKLQFLLLGLISLAYFLLTRNRHKPWLVLSLLCVLLNLAEILPWYFNQPEIINLEQQPLKVLSYNVLWSNQKYDQAIALVKQEQPDIAVFQEAIAPWNQELKALQSDYPYQIHAEKLEIEVYSKLPLNNPEIRLYGTYRGLVIADIKVGGGSREQGDRALKFVATHAYPQLYFGSQGWKIRNRQLEVGIGEYAKSLKQPVVIIGDLNVAMWSPFYRSLIKNSGLRNARQGFGILPSHSVVAPQYAALSAPIDHCLVSADIQVQNFKLGQAIGSDHRPIIADLLIPPML